MGWGACGAAAEVGDCVGATVGENGWNADCAVGSGDPSGVGVLVILWAAIWGMAGGWAAASQVPSGQPMEYGFQ